MSRIFLFHWNEGEAKAEAERLRKLGYQVEFEHADGARGGTKVVADPPDLILVSLERLPSHGRETAGYLAERKATRHVPIVFVECEDANKLAKVKAAVPGATFVKRTRLDATLARLLSGSRS